MRLLTVIVLLLGQVAYAQVPNLIGYQGRLLKSDGTPATGTATMKFTFYDTPTGGTALWTETQTVALTNGFYATFLGSVNALPANLFNGQDRYLEVSVDGTSLSPRLRAGSVPHALAASRARDVSGGVVDAQSVSVSGVEVIDPSGKLVGPATAVTQINAAPPLAATSGTTPTLSLSSCAAGEVLKWIGTAWACAADNVGSGGVASVTAGPGIAVTGTATQPVISVAFGTGANSAVQGNDERLVPPASVTAYLGNTAPQGWVMANGAPASRTQCAGLFAVIGTTYGAGDGATTFGTPNLNNRRFLMGAGPSDSVGATGGSFDHTHGVPSHAHGMAHSHSMAHDHGMNHTHYMDHTHNVNAHVHGTSGLITGNGGSTYNGVCANGTARSCGAHEHNITGATDPSSPNTSGATLQNTGGASSTVTGPSNSPNTGQSSAPVTDPGGAGTSGPANPPYFAINYIIKC